MLPGGVLAITVSGAHPRGVKFVAARNDSDLQALAAYRASSLAARPFAWPAGLALTNDGLLVCSYIDSSTALYKFAKDGSMDELATLPKLADRASGFNRCAVHQQTQRTYGIYVIDAKEETHALVILDANLQVVATVETAVALRMRGDNFEPICDVAVHGDQVVVLASSSHPEGSGLRLLDLDGRFLRTIAAGLFWQDPTALAVSHGRAFVVDAYVDPYDDEEEQQGKHLYIIDIQSGNILQSVPLELKGRVSTIIVEGDEIFISGYNLRPFNEAGEIVVLRFAGSDLATVPPLTGRF